MDKTNSAAATGITEGMDEGTLFFFSPQYEMGFSPDCNNVIVRGFTQMLTLGKSKSAPWIYGKPQEPPVPIASFVQQIGRVARRYKGDAYTLSKVVKEIVPKEDLSYMFVAATMSGDIKPLVDYGLNVSKGDANFLRASIALPYKSGLEPEEIMVGLRGRPVEDGKTISSYPTYGNKPTVVDEELWNRHLKQPTPAPLPSGPKIDKDRAKEIFLLMFQTAIRHEPKLRERLHIELENSLIKDV